MSTQTWATHAWPWSSTKRAWKRARHSATSCDWPTTPTPLARSIGASAQLHMAEIYQLQKKYPLSLELAQHLLELARQVGSAELLSEASDTTATTLAKLGKPEEAGLRLAESIAAIEELRGQVAGAEE